MKKIITSVLLVIFLLSSRFTGAQNPHPFELGFNAGASWLQSDVKMKKLGFGYGATFGQTYCMNSTSPLLWGWRFRYLAANTYGQGAQRSYGIANNQVLNGTDTTLNYYNNGGYVFDNYKTHLNEISLEVLIGANRMREKTNFYPYIFGGLGFTKAVAKIDQLDGSNHRYDYSLIDSTGARSQVLGDLKGLYDGNYESLADGNLSPRWKLMPSIGVGIGYEVVKGFSIGLEHKMTWGLNDVLDGQRWTNTNTGTGNNDKYHYSSFWLKFSFGRGHKTAHTETTTTTSNVNNYTNTAIPVPVITFTNPSTSGTTSTSPLTNITGHIGNINSSNDMSMTLNGNPVTGYTYVPSTQTFSYNASLVSGSNVIVVTASNTSGSVSASTNVIYNNTPVVVETTPAPIVRIDSPNANPYSTGLVAMAVAGSIQNISAKSQMQMMLNGAVIPASNYTFNASTHAYSVNINLITGSNTLVISATNAGGSDSKTLVINYQRDMSTYSSPAPVVTFVNPSVNPFNTSMAVAGIVANVTNVSTLSQIAVNVNGVPAPASVLSFNASTHQLNFNVNLLPGANSIVVSAANSSGNDSKTETINYSAPVTIPSPIVTITSPSNPFNTTVNTANVTASVLHITAASQISVTLNGGPLPASALSYNLSTHVLNFTVHLIAGANSIVVSATNVSGADSKTEVIVYTAPAATPAPVVTITNPAVNPFNTTTNTANINANVLNVSGASQITATVNGVNTTAFAFNPSTHQLGMSVNLIAGANTITIAATNASGNDSKTETIIYNVPVAVLAPVITITNPTSNPYTTNSNTVVFSANVLNVANAAEITLKVNGVTTNAFTFNAATHQLMMNVSLVLGSNNVLISASNAGGSDSKTQTIIYSIPAVVVPPVITITNPTASPFATTTASTTVNAIVSNVSSASQITVTLNGAATTAFTYTASTQQLVFNAGLIAGSNTVIISATNAGGTASQTQVINYTAPAPLAPPVVSFITPATSPTAASSNTIAIVAKVLNVINASQITVKVNGTAITTFGFAVLTKKVTFTANLIAGSNSIVISATNAAGSDSKTMVLTYINQVSPMNPDTLANPINPVGPGGAVRHRPGLSPADPASPIGTTPVGGTLPEITLMTPATASVTTTDAVYALSVKVSGITNASAISVKINGVVFTGFSYNTHSQVLSFPVTLNAGANTVLITATNGSGPKSTTITITK